MIPEGDRSEETGGTIVVDGVVKRKVGAYLCINCKCSIITNSDYLCQLPGEKYKKYLLFSAVTAKMGTDEKESQETIDKGATFNSVSCDCGCILGKKYQHAPDELKFLLKNYLLEMTQLSCMYTYVAVPKPPINNEEQGDTTRIHNMELRGDEMERRMEDVAAIAVEAAMERCRLNQKINNLVLLINSLQVQIDDLASK